VAVGYLISAFQIRMLADKDRDFLSVVFNGMDKFVILAGFDIEPVSDERAIY
jgi:hypothetical protein